MATPKRASLVQEETALRAALYSTQETEEVLKDRLRAVRAQIQGIDLAAAEVPKET